MKHLFIYIGMVFLGLLIFMTARRNQMPSEIKPIVRVYASSSFISQWGPGPWLKAEFEKTCNCRIEFFEAIDSYLMMQKIKSEAVRGVDVVLGLDLFDLEMAKQALQWKTIEQLDDTGFDTGVRKINEFVPYNYSQLAIIYRASDLEEVPKNLKDLAKPQYKDQIALIDPRSSSLGMQFLLWAVAYYGQTEAIEIFKAINQNVKLYASNWSAAYGLFREKQVKLVLSYITSPVYHRIEDKTLDIQAAAFSEGHPVQIEFGGVPSVCKQCELGEQFIKLLVSDEGQKIVMEKNYMFPIKQKVRLGTPFAEVPPFDILSLSVPKLSERESLIRSWSQSRR